MYSMILDICFITMAVCLAVIILGATIMMVKDFKDDLKN